MGNEGLGEWKYGRMGVWRLGEWENKALKRRNPYGIEEWSVKNGRLDYGVLKCMGMEYED